MIKTIFRRTVVALSVVGALLVMPVTTVLQAAAAESMSETQKEAVGAVVREYLLNNPEILREMMTALEAKETRERTEGQSKALSENADRIFRNSKDIVLGNPAGDITLVEFFDYNCGFCKRALGDLQTLLKTDKNLKIVMKEYPILSAGSLGAARVSLAAAKQGKYMELHAALLNSRGQADADKALSIAKKLGLDMSKLKTDMEHEDVMASISSASKLARSLGINGTPAYIIDGTIIPGAVGLETLRSQIAQIRKKGCKYC